MQLFYDFMIAVFGTLFNIIVPIFKLDRQNDRNRFTCTEYIRSVSSAKFCALRSSRNSCR